MPPGVRVAAPAGWFGRAPPSGRSFIRLWTWNGKNGFLSVERTRRRPRRCSTRGFVSPCSSRVSPRYGPTIEASRGGGAPPPAARALVGHAPDDVQRSVGGPFDDSAVVEIGRRLLPLLNAATAVAFRHLVPGFGAAGGEVGRRGVA